MKKVLCLIALVCFVFLNLDAQRSTKDSAKWSTLLSHWATMPVDNGYTSSDTGMVLLLCSDTTKIYNFYNSDGSLFGYKMTNVNDLPKGGKMVFTGFLNQFAFNVMGYEVTEHSPVSLRRWLFDANKKPLPKSFIIWQYIKLNYVQP